jgi:hypothetical protein
MLLDAPGGATTESRERREPRNDSPTRAEIREALWWALENDWAAVLEHRSTAHTTRHEGFRQQADRELVQRWREALGTSLDAPRHPEGGAPD